MKMHVDAIISFKYKLIFFVISCLMTLFVFFGYQINVKIFEPTKKIDQTFHQLQQRLEVEPLDHLIFQDVNKNLSSTMMNRTLLERSIYVPNDSSFKRVLKKALTGQKSAGSQLGKKESRRYYSLLKDYLKYVFEPLGSTLNVENLSLSSSTSRFHALCFENYLNLNSSADIVIWESSVNDWAFIKDMSSTAAWLELLTRRLFNYFGNDLLLVHLHLTLGRHHPCKSIIGLGGSKLSQYYEIPMINWHMVACDARNTPKQNLWGLDRAHPSELSHAYIGYQLIHMFRSVFRYQTDTLVKMNTRQEIVNYLNGSKFVLREKKSLYLQSNGLKEDAVCFTYNIVANGGEAKNKLKVKIIQNEGYSIIKAHSFKDRKDIIQGLGISARPNKTLHFEIDIPKKSGEGSWRLFIGTYGKHWNYANITVDGDLKKYELFCEWGHAMAPIAYVTEGKHNLIFRSLPDGNFLVSSIALN